MGNDRVEVAAALIPDFVGGFRCIHASYERAIQAEEDAAHVLKLVELLKGIGGIAPRANSFKTSGGVEIEKKDEVRFWSKFLIFCQDPIGINASGALVGCGGKVIAIEEDGPPFLQSWPDHRFDMFGAILKTKV